MNKLLIHLLLIVPGFISVQCNRNQPIMNRNESSELIGSYYFQSHESGSYEYIEVQFTPERYMLYYHISEGRGGESVYKVTSDSTFIRWWFREETKSNFYHSENRDTLYLQPIDSLITHPYYPYIRIFPEITISDTFKNDSILEEFSDQVWLRQYEVYNP